ncbi:MAG: metallophosphoesterase [Lentisphaeraceae bacterium]|nr:metallophosphoesterase [Lentisphaeraceae bacterium]
MHRYLRKALKLSGLEKRGLNNVINFNVIERSISFKRLDPYWQGKRILHLSDTHLDGVPGLLERLLEEIPKLEYDLCLFTGDFRFGKGKFHPVELQPTLDLLSIIKAPLGTFGILGNHDFIEQVPALEKHGMKILLNENCSMGHGLSLIGVDDPHLYKCHDISAALQGVDQNDIKIFLVHSPEIVQEAADAGLDWYLCGHTHGGQIALPIVGAPFSNARCARKYAFGEFSCGNMQGYTHNGTGASSVAVRFACPSEVVIHTLNKA